jgi:2-polyprenyl-6-hydroxyphenyl methylase/3-demethylubiquinone-9 3-methyltransferase
MTTHIQPTTALAGQEIARGERFRFGANWARFSDLVDERRIRLAEASLQRTLGVDTLAGRRFIDVGSGSGLFSLAARRLGATVYSFDYDPDSVATTSALKQRFAPGDGNWHIGLGSALDSRYMQSLGTWDVVYSWGVLHHTGAMWDALDNVISLVGPHGTLYIALYNDQYRISKLWRVVKRAYNRLPTSLRWTLVVPVLVRVWGPRTVYDVLRGRRFQAWREYAERSVRGMSAWRDLLDWVGGYPFEVATPDKVVEFCRARGLVLSRLRTVGGGHGCNEYVFVRSRIEGI